MSTRIPHSERKLTDADLDRALVEIRRKLWERYSAKRQIVVLPGIPEPSSYPLCSTRIEVSQDTECLQIRRDGATGPVIATHPLNLEIDSRSDTDDKSGDLSLTEYIVGEHILSIIIPSHTPRNGKVEVDVAVRCAVPDLTSDAIRTLTRDQTRRLKRYAQWRIRGLGLQAEGRDYRDLLNEAIVRTLDGKRNSGMGVDFYWHLIATMRSISDSWRRHKTPHFCGSVYDTSARFDERGAEQIREDRNPETVLQAKEMMEQVENAFSNDGVASVAVYLLSLGYNVREIRDYLQLSEREVRALVRRIRRRLEKMLSHEDGALFSWR